MKQFKSVWHSPEEKPKDISVILFLDRACHKLLCGIYSPKTNSITLTVPNSCEVVWSGISYWATLNEIDFAIEGYEIALNSIANSGAADNHVRIQQLRNQARVALNLPMLPIGGGNGDM